MIKILLLIFFSSCFGFSFGQKKIEKKPELIVLKFENIANRKKIIFNDSSYTNDFGEKYTVSKLKYYVSNVRFITTQKYKSAKNIFLIDAAKENTITFLKPSGKITGIEFLLGVDSILNCSGGQSGALDPLNDMFWTWNSGYVMFKMEGRSDASKADLQRLEQHIGGYKGEFKTVRKIFVPIDKRYFLNKKIGADKIVINVNLDKYWNGKNKIRINEQPMITTIGKAARDAADNFEGMFSVKTTD